MPVWLLGNRRTAGRTGSQSCHFRWQWRRSGTCRNPRVLLHKVVAADAGRSVSWLDDVLFLLLGTSLLAVSFECYWSKLFPANKFCFCVTLLHWIQAFFRRSRSVSVIAGQARSVEPAARYGSWGRPTADCEGPGARVDTRVSAWTVRSQPAASAEAGTRRWDERGKQ